MSNKFSVTEQEEILLLKEAGIASSSINNGLTSLRKANFVQKSHYYQVFFQLTIGIERLMKLIIIHNFRIANNNKFPDNKILKNYGHNINDLFKIVSKYKPNDFKFKLDDPIYDQILNCLSNFAMSSRYYNLDTLTGRTDFINKDPLKVWNEIQEEIKKRHYKEKEFKPEVKLMIEEINEISVYRYHDESDNLINNAQTFYDKGKSIKVVQEYSVYYLYKIINYLVEILSYFEYENNIYPYLREFFPLYQGDWWSILEIRRKKDWTRLG